MKAIETRYKGYRFRSRLEARWAVFFDALGLRWEYESQGYDVRGRHYLPDFSVDAIGFVEVKPLHDRDAALEKDRETWAALAKQSQRSVFVVLGQPGDANIPGICGGETGGGVWFDPTRETESLFWFCECRRCGGLAVEDRTGTYALYGCVAGCESEKSPAVMERIAYAVSEARGARFEHGETPAPTPKPAALPKPRRPHAWESSPEVKDLLEKIALIDEELPRANPDRQDELIEQKLDFTQRLQAVTGQRWKRRPGG